MIYHFHMFFIDINVLFFSYTFVNSHFTERQSFSNQLEVNYNNNYSTKGFQNVYMYGRDK